MYIQDTRLKEDIYIRDIIMGMGVNKKSNEPYKTLTPK